MSSLQYPTGPFEAQASPLTGGQRAELVSRIRAIPGRARAAVAHLSDEQLDTPYREGGWSPRQITHHLADSHMNGFIRLKLALTEEHPGIRPYDQAAWATQADVTSVPVALSLTLLDGLHQRWCALWSSLDDPAFARTAHHPEIGDISVEFLLQLYAWHGDHHVTQVEELRRRQGW